MNLPANYIEVEVDTLNGKTVGVGVLNLKSERNCLYLFSPDYTFEYSREEVIENFQLFNPKDGIKYDLNKLFNL